MVDSDYFNLSTYTEFLTEYQRAYTDCVQIIKKSIISESDESRKQIVNELTEFNNFIFSGITKYNGDTYEKIIHRPYPLGDLEFPTPNTLSYVKSILLRSLNSKEDSCIDLVLFLQRVLHEYQTDAIQVKEQIKRNKLKLESENEKINLLKIEMKELSDKIEEWKHDADKFFSELEQGEKVFESKKNSLNNYSANTYVFNIAIEDDSAKLDKLTQNRNLAVVKAEIKEFDNMFLLFLNQHQNKLKSIPRDMLEDFISKLTVTIVVSRLTSDTTKDVKVQQKFSGFLMTKDLKVELAQGSSMTFTHVVTTKNCLNFNEDFFIDYEHALIEIECPSLGISRTISVTDENLHDLFVTPVGDMPIASPAYYSIKLPDPITVNNLPKTEIINFPQITLFNKIVAKNPTIGVFLAGYPFEMKVEKVADISNKIEMMEHHLSIMEIENYIQNASIELPTSPEKKTLFGQFVEAILPCFAPRVHYDDVRKDKKCWKTKSFLCDPSSKVCSGFILPGMEGGMAFLAEYSKEESKLKVYILGIVSHVSALGKIKLNLQFDLDFLK